MSIRLHLLLTVTLVALGGAFLGFHQKIVNETALSRQQALSIAVLEIARITAFEETLKSMLTTMDLYLASDQPLLLPGLSNYLPLVSQELEHFARYAKSNEARRLTRELNSLHQQIEYTVLADSQTKQSATDNRLQQFDDQSTKLVSTFKKLIQEARRQEVEIRSNLAAATVKDRKLYWWFMAAFFLSVAGLLIWLLQRISKPLVALTRNASHSIEGHKPFHPTVRGAYEIVTLSTTLGRLINSLEQLVEERTTQLAKEAKRLKHEVVERKQAEYALSIERSNLEKTVNARTVALRQSVEQLEISNKRLEEANLHKSKFLSAMSHELRTPLNGILGFTDLLGIQNFGDLNEKQHDYVRQINESGSHLLTLVNDLLDVAKIDAGVVDLDTEPAELSDTIASVITMMDAQFQQKHITVDTYVEPDLPTVDLDVRRGRQILLNILSNAIKYTPDNGIIEIFVTTSNDDCIRVDISDSGIGVEKEHAANVFSEFYQANRMRDERLGGTGIGLALTQRLVQMHDGEIGVVSPAVFNRRRMPEGTCGATFWFTLPLAVC
jgi:signal transduction histidine kinase